MIKAWVVYTKYAKNVVLARRTFSLFELPSLGERTIQSSRTRSRSPFSWEKIKNAIHNHFKVAVTVEVAVTVVGAVVFHHLQATSVWFLSFTQRAVVSYHLQATPVWFLSFTTTGSCFSSFTNGSCFSTTAHQDSINEDLQK